ncbi:MAG TPA: MarR family winged helix-turn-helix transcriptional regulator [Sphingopyxis sp.]|uniref:MarR family winged helix-turn-helix transcriptional regulator n=1 Tax=Sphingopyxis sp. TaxID=1908224 RepID=UPI002CE19E6D|nr:MarR family winged helix-turn-helix transcriptional regulator [Sphingopyxis sp.]HWW59092.1 MarR family winged helix-turn-helix transcriptional regulator [Sphingopyxis sp.]
MGTPIMKDYEIGIDVPTLPPGGFGAGDMGPPDTIGRYIPESVASPLLLVGQRTDLPDMAFLPDIRLARILPPSHAAGCIRQMATLDIVWLSAADAVEGQVLADICTALDERGCSLICETSLLALDRIAAALPASLRAQLLVDADPADKLVALAAARRIRHGAVHDIARDDAMERIDRLQEEVARISRLLGDIAGQRGGLSGTPTGFAPWNEGPTDHPDQVRAPSRDYAAMPRSFVPEERVLDRQRAKQIRRMLRQRRMREQYFPADLFADPAWDMLLDLYAARLERQPVSVSSLCIAAAVPATTALRWIKTMTDAGLFLREADPHDGRRIFIALAEGACDALARYFDALEE